MVVQPLDFGIIKDWPLSTHDSLTTNSYELAFTKLLRILTASIDLPETPPLKREEFESIQIL